MGQYTPKLKIGYLGGGQLARMLAESAHRMGLEAHILCPSADEPAAQVSHHWHQGSLEDEKTLYRFLSSVDVATFESEFLNATKLTAAAQSAEAQIFPSAQLMGSLQDRQSQKSLYDQYKLPTSPWASVNTVDEVQDFIEEQALPVVFKKRFFGYDGYGTFVVKTKKQLHQFLQNDFQPDLFIVEKFIPFKKECAIILARSADQSQTHLPLVESFQKDSRCDWVKGPIKMTAAKPLIKKLQSFLKKIDYVGVMGVEFFMTSKGLIINEIAPRVHNTGHYSQNTSSLSQFDLHNMCLLGLKLPKEIEIKGGFAMANLIGGGQEVQLKPVQGLHWYGKADNRKGRKMGHINATGATPNAALKEALKKRKGIQL